MSFDEMVQVELARACNLHNPYNSAHEAYALIAEELDEFWDLVRLRNHKTSDVRGRMLKELVQVAVTAQRAAHDLGLLSE